MSAHPWMPLYVADFLADTPHLSAGEIGAYLLLIMHYWQRRGLPKDDERLARIARMKAEDWAQVRPTLRELFSDDEWTHKRVEEELAKADDLSGKRSAAGKAGAEARHGKRIASEQANAPPLPTQSQSQSPSNTHSPRRRIDPGWKPNAESLQFAELRGIRDVNSEAETFKNHCIAEGVEKEDFDAYWRKWCGNSISERKRYAGTGKPARRTPADAVADRLKEMEHEQAGSISPRGDVEFLPPGGEQPGFVAPRLRRIPAGNG